MPGPRQSRPAGLNDSYLPGAPQNGAEKDFQPNSGAGTYDVIPFQTKFNMAAGITIKTKIPASPLAAGLYMIECRILYDSAGINNHSVRLYFSINSSGAVSLACAQLNGDANVNSSYEFVNGLLTICPFPAGVNGLAIWATCYTTCQQSEYFQNWTLSDKAGGANGFTIRGFSVGGACAINAALALNGALSGVTTLSMNAGITGVTTIIMAGALSGVTTLGMSGALSGATSIGCTSVANSGNTATVGITNTGPEIVKRRTVTATTDTATTSDYEIWYDATSNNIAATLPAQANGRKLVLKRVDTVTLNTVTITPASGTVEGSASITLAIRTAGTDVLGNFVHLTSDGTNWAITG